MQKNIDECDYALTRLAALEAIYSSPGTEARISRKSFIVKNRKRICWSVFLWAKSVRLLFDYRSQSGFPLV